MAEAADSTGLSQVARVVDVFVSPSETFTDIRRSAAWWMPFLLIAIATLSVTYVIDRKVGFLQVAEVQMRMSPAQEEQLSGLSAADRSAQMTKISAGYRYSSYAAPAIVLIIASLGSLALWASFNFGLGAQTTFSQILCLWMYCSLPRLLGAVATIGSLLYGSNVEGFDLKEPVASNVGFYLPDSAAWVRTLLSFVDVIGIWVLVLLIVGGAIVAKVKVSQVAIVVVGWWLLIVLVSTAATAAFS